MRFVLIYFDVLPRFSSIFLVLLNFRSAKALEVECENVERFGSGYNCIMKATTEITSDDTKITDGRNMSITTIEFSGNRKIFFLPIDIHEKIPNLLSIYAQRCSISSISKKNFNKLSELKNLNLCENRIEKIESDTFEDLLNLRSVHLCKVFPKL